MRLLQTFEMESPQDEPLCVAAHPTQQVLALGFKSGAVRVLAIHGPAIWMEANHHLEKIVGIWFVPASASAAGFGEESLSQKLSGQQEHHHQFLLPQEGIENGVLQQSHLVISSDAAGCKGHFTLRQLVSRATRPHPAVCLRGKHNSIAASSRRPQRRSDVYAALSGIDRGLCFARVGGRRRHLRLLPTPRICTPTENRRRPG